MPEPVERAPTGQWKMPNPELAAELGIFVMAWSQIEATFEVCIAKQLDLGPVPASIVTSGMQFRSRCSTLISLLNRSPDQNSKAIRLAKEASTISDRNDILHSVVGGSEDQIWFNRRTTTGDKFKSKIVKYDAAQLRKVSIKCVDIAVDLGKELGIERNYYSAFFQEAHNRANNL